MYNHVKITKYNKLDNSKKKLDNLVNSLNKLVMTLYSI